MATIQEIIASKEKVRTEKLFKQTNLVAANAARVIKLKVSNIGTLIVTKNAPQDVIDWVKNG